MQPNADSSSPTISVARINKTNKKKKIARCFPKFKFSSRQRSNFKSKLYLKVLHTAAFSV